MNNAEKIIIAITAGCMSFALYLLLGYFMFRNVYTPSYPDRTAEVEALQVAFDDIEAELASTTKAFNDTNLAMINTCIYLGKSNGVTIYYHPTEVGGTTTPSLAWCDEREILATSTEQ